MWFCNPTLAQQLTAMTTAQIINNAAKFTCLSLAENYKHRAFETNNKSLSIVLIDYPYIAVCSHREASILIKAGYELAKA